MGIDLTEYGQFMARMPRASGTVGGTDVLTHPTGYTATSEDIDFGVQFVVTAALRIADEPPIQRLSINEAGAGISIHRYLQGALAAGPDDSGEPTAVGGMVNPTEQEGRSR